MPAAPNPPPHRPPGGEPPPPLGSWPRLYALVIGTDVAIIVLLTLLTRWFD